MSCTTLINGSAAMVEQPKSRSYSVKNGWVTTRSWRGPTAYADSLISSLIGGGAESLKIDSSGPDTTVTATFSDANGGGTVSNEQNKTWGFSETVVQRNLDTMPYYKTSTDLSDVISSIKKTAEDTAPSEVVIATITGYSALSAGDKTKAENYLAQRAKGVDFYEEHMPTITLNIVQSRRATVKASLVNCNKKVSYSDIGLPGDVPWDEPTYQNLSGTATSYEWLKGYPSVEFDGLRSTISQSWVGFQKLSAIMYGGTETP